MGIVVELRVADTMNKRDCVQYDSTCVLVLLTRWSDGTTSPLIPLTCCLRRLNAGSIDDPRPPLVDQSVLGLATSRVLAIHIHSWSLLAR